MDASCGPEKSTELESVMISYITTPNIDVARELAKSLISLRLGACVNIVPGVESIYEWQGELQSDQECLLIVKSTATCINQLIQHVRQNHPYEVPEIVSTRVKAGCPAYLDWVRTSCSAKVQQPGASKLCTDVVPGSDADQ